jgi:hypothetical protein
MKTKQKFFRGQRVHICKDLGKCMSHFTNDKDAIVMGSYSDLYGGNGRQNHIYSLLIKDKTHWFSCSWYEEWQLTLIDKDRDKGERILQRYKNR